MSRHYPVDVNRSQFDARPVVVLPDDFYDYVNEGPSVYVITDADVPDIVEAVIDACWYAIASTGSPTVNVLALT